MHVASATIELYSPSSANYGLVWVTAGFIASILV